MAAKRERGGGMSQQHRDADRMAELAGVIAARAAVLRMTSSPDVVAELTAMLPLLELAVSGVPTDPIERERDARDRLLAYCQAYRGRGISSDEDLRAAALTVARALADVFPELRYRVMRARAEIAYLIEQQAGVRRRGRPKAGDGLAWVANGPDIETATIRLCKAVGLQPAKPESVTRARRRRKK